MQAVGDLVRTASGTRPWRPTARQRWAGATAKLSAARALSSSLSGGDRAATPSSVGTSAAAAPLAVGAEQQDERGAGCARFLRQLENRGDFSGCAVGSTEHQAREAKVVARFAASRHAAAASVCAAPPELAARPAHAGGGVGGE
eukprot:SAG11_NODE_6517_length_1297_cov_2.727045_3_plen_143_part_01